jgi:hypothetical protein
MRNSNTPGLWISVALALVACGGSESAGPVDAAVVDGAAGDGATGDGATSDARLDAATDASPDAALMGVSAEIAAARATADGTGLTLTITSATVTYVRPAIENDPAGFYIQGELTGPALLIQVDPASLTPTPIVGDVVSFTITEMGTFGSLRQALAITGFTRDSQGADVDALVQAVSATTDLVSALAGYESELVDVSGTISGSFGFAGTGFEQAAISTAGIAADPQLRLRIPQSLMVSADIAIGCAFVASNVPVGRFNSTVQIAAFTAGDITVSGCPAPRVTRALALASDTVQVEFDRNLDPVSVLTDGSQFTVDGGVTVSAAAASGRVVMLTTSTQIPDATYLVSVATTVTDLSGTALDSAAASASFLGFLQRATVRINEVNANITSGCDLIELRVVQGGSMNGYTLWERDNVELLAFTGLTVATNDLIVVHLDQGDAINCNPSAATSETTAIDQAPQATHAMHHDTAWDWWSADAGLFATDNVITLYDITDVIMDAVLLTDDPARVTAAGDSEDQAAIVAAAGQWTNLDGSTPKAGYLDLDFNANAVPDLNGTGTAAGGTSIQRLDDTDDHNLGDWTAAPAASTWGLINTGQSAL